MESLAIASDGLTALLGAIGRRDGVVVAAGTGTACLARRGARFAKVDGWGSLLSDAGSGFAIGRAGLDAALREYDGRGGSERLMEAARERFGEMDRMAGADLLRAGADARGGVLRRRRRASGRGGRRVRRE